MTKHMLQNLWILLLSLLTLGLALLLVLDMIPARTSGIEVKEQVNSVAALIHQCAAAVNGPGAAP